MKRRRSKRETPFYSDEHKYPKGTVELDVHFKLVLVKNLKALQKIVEYYLPHEWGLDGLTCVSNSRKRVHVYVPLKIYCDDRRSPEILENLGHEVAHVADYACDKIGIKRQFDMECGVLKNP